MDVNGTRLHLLLGCADWSRCTDADGNPLVFACDDASPPAAAGAASPPGDTAVAWDFARQELTLRPVPFQFPAGRSDHPPKTTDRRGAGRDSGGNWYWIDPAARGLLVQSSGTGASTVFWPGSTAGPEPRFGGFNASAATPMPPRPPVSGAAVTEDNFLVVGVVDPPGLLVFDLQTADPPSSLPWPEDVPFSPFDMSPRPGGGVFVLDREHARVWELDRHFHVVSGAPSAPVTPQPGQFGPSDSAPPAPALTAGELRAADATAVPDDVIAVEAAPSGGFLALQRGDGQGSLVAWFRDGVRVGPAVPTDGITGYDLALVADSVVLADAAGNQAYAFRLTKTGGDPKLELLLTYYPMRQFGGKGLVAAAGQAYYDFDDRWIPLVAQARPRHVDHATVVTPVFDGRLPGCIWHRLMLDARVPQGTALSVWSKTADDQATLAPTEWRAEPDPRPRRTGSELPFVQNNGYDTHELLFQHARGRYALVKLELRGDGRASPRLRALRTWYPRFSYLTQYLPRVYRQDTASASFLDRYLANVEGFYTAIEDRIAAAQVLLGADTAPADALDWLASWFALTLDPLWDEHRRRAFIRNANRFFQARATMRGIAIALRFALEPCIADGVFDELGPPSLAAARIVEAYRTRKTPGVVFGDPTDQAVPHAIIGTPRWKPDQGRDVLEAGWLGFLEGKGLGGPVPYPITGPGGATGASWRAFSSAALGFVPQAADPGAWSAFLTRRYRGIGALASAYGLTGAAAPADFSTVTPPVELPPDGAPLLDWFQFQSVVIPMMSKAHRFTVLLPWPLHVTDSRGAELDPAQLRALAARIIELQKPAHTTFTVKFFWAAFRVGDARIGDDTLLASGSRVPELVSQAVLGTGYLGESYLAGSAATDTIRRTPRAAADDAEETS